MRRIAPVAFAILLVTAGPSQGDEWPQWRGPELDGTSNETGLPLSWSPTDNIAWKLELPAWSGSTPIIWGDTVFLNVADGENIWLWAVDRNGATGTASTTIAVTISGIISACAATSTTPCGSTPSQRLTGTAPTAA